MSALRDAGRRPPIVLCASDRQALERAALAALLSAPRLAGPLLEEIDRATIVADDALDGETVRLGAWVVYREAASGEVRVARLVGPPQGRGPGELSALTAEGAALIGLRVGQAIRWLDPTGAERRLTVLATAAFDAWSAEGAS